MRRLDDFGDRYGPWALVCGASSGIGRELALEIARLGVHAFLVGRSRDRLEETAEAIRASGRQARVVVADLADPDATAAVAAATRGHVVGLLALAAGYGEGGAFLDSNAAGQRAMIEVNCTSVVAMTRHYAPAMVSRKRGGIIMMGSLLGFQGNPYTANYAATKGYVQSFGEALAVELAETGVDVLVSAPGPVATRFGERAGMRLDRAMKATEVARATLRALGHSHGVQPGMLTKFLRGSLMFLPRAARVRVMGRVIKGMLRA